MRFRPALEFLERYRLLSLGIFSVVTAADNGSNASPTSGSLRWALEQANALGAGNAAEIDFAVTAVDSSPIVINLASGGNPLPNLTVPTFINGFTEGVFDGIAGYAGAPLVEINGSLGSGQNGITFTTGSSGSTIQGLSIVNFTESSGSGGAAIFIDPHSQTDLIENNYLGLLPDGTTAGPNNIGINVASNGNTIGGSSASAGNVVSGNLTGGILVLEQYTSGTQVPLSGNAIGGNRVGTTAAGSAALANGTAPRNAAGAGFGIAVSGATGTTIDDNLVSGNKSLGIALTELGTDLTDTAPSGSTLLATTDNLIAGNLVGTNSSGQTALGNNTGIEIAGATGTTIGGTSSGSGNVISGSILDTNGFEGEGVEILGGDATGVVVEGNDIGTDSTGDSALGNASNGVSLEDNTGGNTSGLHSFVTGVPSNVTIGGSAMSAANVIATNLSAGISIVGQTANLSNNDLIEGNQVGIFADGTSSAASGNQAVGILGIGTAQLSVTGNVVENNALDGIEVTSSLNVTVGGSTSSAGNIVAANLNYGIELDLSATSSANVIANNLIGVTTPGATSPSPASGNQNGGIAIFQETGVAVLGNIVENNATVGIGSEQSTDVTIGGSSAAAANTIAANGNFGIEIDGDSGDLIEGNLIGAFAGGVTSASSGNVDLGIFGFGSVNCTFGGTAAGAGNLLTHNGQFGIGFEEMNGFSVAGNTIDSNGSGGVYSTSDHSSSALYLDNTIANNHGGGIQVLASYVNISLQGNDLNNNSGAGISVQQFVTESKVPIRVSMVDDQIMNSGQGGIYVTGGQVSLLLQGSSIESNGGAGVLLNESNATIGGTSAGAGNVIANNAGAGVAIMNHGSTPENAQDLISGNSIYGDLKLGIDLGNTGTILPNGSSASGPNQSQNYPVLSAVNISGSNVLVTGSLIGNDNETYTLQFFSNTAADSTGHGQGQTYVGSASVTTNHSGVANFSVPVGSIDFGAIVSATATDPNNNTSEFSQDVTAVSSSATTVTSSANPSAFGQPVTFTATVTVSAPGTASPTGTITFFNGATQLNATPAALSLVGGQYLATFSSPQLLVKTTGGYSITAVYSGDAETLGSQSAALAQLVNQDQTATGVTTSLSPSRFGQSVTFTATISVTAPGSSTPTDTVNFFDGLTKLNATPATLSLVGGLYQATFSTTTLAVNSISGHSITAVYLGDIDTLGSQSPALAQLVNQDQTATSVATSLSPSRFGQSVTFTATISVTAPGSSTPTGTVNFFDGLTQLNATPAALSLVGELYQATFSTTTLAVNSISGHSITAVYLGDTDTLGSQSPALAQLVNQDQTATSVATSLSPSRFGRSVTFTATISVTAPGSSTPTGTVNFFDGLTQLNATPATLSLVGGLYQATFSTTTLAVNSISGHSITAVYLGDTDTLGSQSPALAQLVNQDQTATSVATSLSPSRFGQSVTLTATVSVTSPGSSTPTGTVNFFDGLTQLNATPATLSLVGGLYQATFSTSTSAVNSISGHSITAVYLGDTDTLGSQSPALAQLVNQDQTATSVATSLSPSRFGQSVTFTATISVTAPGSSTPTGTVNFFDGLTQLNATPATLSLVGGLYQATFSISALAVNTATGHSITAVYLGDTDTLGSQSTPIAQLVNQDQTTTSISTLASPSLFGQSVNFTATVSVTSPGSSTPTGTVSFFDGLTKLNITPATLSLVGGHYQAAFSTSTLSVNFLSGHSITADYTGDTDTLGSQSAPLAQIVNAIATTTNLDASTASANAGQSLTFSATVAALSGTGHATGSVTFFDGSLSIGTVPLDGTGTASLSLDNLAVGLQQVSAIYGGDASHAPSTSNVESVSIVAQAPAIGPTVMSVKRYGTNNQRPTYLLISFSAPLEMAQAQLVSNYAIAGPIQKRKTPKRGPAISSAVYDPSTSTVTLVIARTWSASSQWRLTVNGSTSSGLTGANGAPLNGAGSPPATGNPLPGTNYATVITHKNLAGAAKRLPTKALISLSRRAAVARAKSVGPGRAIVFGTAAHSPARHR